MLPKYSKKSCWSIICISLYHILSKENKNKIWYQMVPRTILLVILLCFGTEVLKKSCWYIICISLYQFVSVCISLYQFVSVCINLYQFVSVCISLYLGCIISYEESNVWYQMVPETILMVILLSFGTKVLKKELPVYGFPCWYISMSLQWLAVTMCF